MKIDRVVQFALVTGALALTSVGASAQQAAKQQYVPQMKTIGQVTPTGPVPSLAVINSKGATLEGGKLVLTGVSPTAILFADRPVRAAGHVTVEQGIMQWDEDKGDLIGDPPNATISVLGGDGSNVSDAVVTLLKPKLEGDTLTFDVNVLEGSLDGATGPAALFIDRFGAHFGGGGFHGSFARVGDVSVGHVGGGYYHGGGYWHAPVYHGAWYGLGAAAATGAVVGAAAGAAAAAPYYGGYYGGGACGYYPYPPCY